MRGIETLFEVPTTAKPTRGRNRRGSAATTSRRSTTTCRTRRGPDASSGTTPTAGATWWAGTRFTAARSLAFSAATATSGRALGTRTRGVSLGRVRSPRASPRGEPIPRAHAIWGIPRRFVQILARREHARVFRTDEPDPALDASCDELQLDLPADPKSASSRFQKAGFALRSIRTPQRVPRHPSHA